MTESQKLARAKCEGFGKKVRVHSEIRHFALGDVVAYRRPADRAGSPATMVVIGVTRCGELPDPSDDDSDFRIGQWNYLLATYCGEYKDFGRDHWREWGTEPESKLILVSELPEDE